MSPIGDKIETLWGSNSGRNFLPPGYDPIKTGRICVQRRVVRGVNPELDRLLKSQRCHCDPRVGVCQIRRGLNVVGVTDRAGDSDAWV